MLILLTALGMLLHAGSCDICMLPPDAGSCSDPSQAKEELRYYYSAKNLKCTEMPYTGCGGNLNNFETLEDCKTECGKPLYETSMALSIAEAQKNSQCWYGNRTYNLGESVDAANRRCSVDCLCDRSFPIILCAQVECAFDYKEKADCVSVYKTGNECCPDFYCPGGHDDSGTVPFTCRYKGEQYVEGQEIDTGDYPCISCRCNKNWKGQLTTDGGVCKELNCGLDVGSPFGIINKCVLEFYTTRSGKESCCAIGFKCTNSDDDSEA